MTEGNPDAAGGSELYEDEFTWGEPEQERSSNSNRQQFYKSFWYDGEQFFLYDYVYLNSGDDDAPFIGKIMRLWEVKEKKLKKVRVRWLYRPSDIPEEITNVDRSPGNKEVFLSCGEKDGVENVNDLAVVCGKCKILCTAADERNEQPSESQLAEAHHFFCRSFNVDEQELYPNLDKAVKELGARKVFNNAWTSAPKVAVSSGRVQKDKSNKIELENMASLVSPQNASDKGKKRLQKKAVELQSPALEVFEEDRQEPASASEVPGDLSGYCKFVELGPAISPANTKGSSLSVDAKGTGSSEVKDTITPKLLNDPKPIKRHLDAVTDVPRKKMKVQSKKPDDQDGAKKSTVGLTTGKSPKSLGKTASSSILDTKDDTRKNLQTTLNKEPQVPTKGGDLVPSKRVKIEDQKIVDKGKLSRSYDDTDNKKKSISNVGSKKSDVVLSRPELGKLTATSPKQHVVIPVSDLKIEDQKIGDNKKKSICIVGTKKSDFVGSGPEVGKVTATSPKQPMVSSSSDPKIEDQKIVDNKKKSISTVGMKKSDAVGSGPEPGKVMATSPKQHVIPSASDSKDNAHQILPKTMLKREADKSVEGVESGVCKKIKADDQKRSDESSLSRFSSSVSQTPLGSKTNISGIKRNEANGLNEKTLDKTQQARSSDLGVFKKPKTVDLMSGAGVQSSRGSDNNFKSLLDRDSAKSMMLEAKAKPFESKVLMASERRRIFREPTLEEKVEKGFKDGMVVHLKNFDVSLTKEDLEGGLKTFIPRFEVVMFSQKDLPHIFPSSRGDTVLDSGQALLVFRDKGQGDVALRLLQESCVVLADDGRPLLATEVEQRVPGKSTKFIGHINLDKFKSGRSLESEGMRNAVATSHCSQPNTIEYEMAIQWRVIDEQKQMQWEHLRKKQEEAVKLLLRKHT
ncbi:hypothetical protein O6H91_21G028600 [Diphasiastrum complanatum]|uniref:Uncharacterized protein n=3 Tax=Diphasiastrum complanatum TaxID=34168 RepID=A0ACC2AKB2_DIPCM|nr:hypothetical protein O6H91_21G028600 [Diphasiastrum complanatum]KAJ7517545.1 hypothetical protein O6H91_21G028600 [Diphasiastrum complanatum]KAJ7517547.1 hypothetical protein O6H91_21G028600 [Diphasiastrum complanatum]